MPHQSRAELFAKMFVGKLDKQIKVNGKKISRRELILRAAIEGAQRGDAYFQKMLVKMIEENPPSKDFPII